jgi:PAS domain S-box-containing protein
MPKRVRKRPGGEFGSGRARVAIIALILFVITLLATRVATTLVYNASLAQTKERLREYVQAQASAIQSMAALQERVTRSLPPSAKRADPRQWVLDLLSEAHALYRGAGRTGEFNIAEAQGDSILFLLRHRRGSVTLSDSRPARAGQRTPMRLALEGKSGTMVGADERGVKVVAAYEPVKAYGWGAVAKIDLAEVREPFGQAGLAGSLIALLLIITGTWLVFRVTDPIFNHIVESEERFRGAFESAAVGISLVTPDGMLLRANETLGRMLGYTLKELQSTDFSALVHPDDKAESSRLIRSTVAAERGTFDVELRLVHKDGNQVWARITSALLRDSEGRPTYFVTVVQDVTVRRQAEEELRKSRALLQGVIDNDLVMVYALDRDGRFILANRKMEKLLSSGPGGLVGQTREAVMPLAAAEQQRENDNEVIKTGRLVVFEEESDEPDGKRFYLSVKSPLRDTDGQTVAVAGVSIDAQAGRDRAPGIGAAFPVAVPGGSGGHQRCRHGWQRACRQPGDGTDHGLRIRRVRGLCADGHVRGTARRAGIPAVAAGARPGQRLRDAAAAQGWTRLRRAADRRQDRAGRPPGDSDDGPGRDRAEGGPERGPRVEPGTGAARRGTNRAAGSGEQGAGVLLLLRFA